MYCTSGTTNSAENFTLGTNYLIYDIQGSKTKLRKKGKAEKKERENTCCKVLVRGVQIQLAVHGSPNRLQQKVARERGGAL